jgi:hypothetical protein
VAIPVSFSKSYLWDLLLDQTSSRLLFVENCMASQFPPPPASVGLQSYAAMAASDDYMSRSSNLPPERDAAAENAIVDSLRHVVSEYAKRALQSSIDDRTVPGKAELEDIEFVPSGRCANDTPTFALFAATMMSLAPILNHLVIILLCVGAMLTYVLDMLGHRNATMIVMVGTFVVGWITFYFVNFADAWNSPSAMLIVLSVGLLFALAACRALLSFKSMQARQPVFVLMLENLINAGLPFVATPPLLAALVGLCGARLAPFALVPVLCVLHYFFYLPKQSSFLEIATDVRKKAAEELVLMIGPFEAGCGTVFTILLPAVMYPALTNDAMEVSWFNFCNYAFLVAAPTLYLLALDPKVTLWWLRYVWVHETQVRITPNIGDEESRAEGDEPVVTMRISALDSVRKARWIAAFVCYSAILHFAVERLINSRFSYLVVGVTPPFNYVLLLCIGYVVSVVLAAAGLLVAEEAQGKKTKYTPLLWVCALVASVTAAVATGVVAGMPGFFIPMMALSAACFVAYLIDRHATNNYVTFMCATTITLTWWMFKTFSFIRQDLHVIGDHFTVSTNEVAGSVLIAYILGGCCIPLAFAKNKGPLVIVMVLHGLKISFLEHVLYSQTADSAYPPAFVIATSVVGIAVAYRLYKNEVLTDLPAAYVMGLYASKFFVYLVHINVADNEDVTFALEVFVTELFSMAACAVLAIAELRHRTGQNITTPQFMSVIVCWFLVLALGMRDTVLRLIVEWIGFSRPSVVQLTAASALACFAFGFVLTGRYVTKIRGNDTDEQQEAGRAAIELRNRLRKWMLYGLVASAALLAVDPSLEEMVTGEGTEDVGDNPFIAPWWSRWAIVLVMALIAAGSRLPLHRIHPVLRGIYFVVGSVLLSLAATPIVIPASDYRVVAALTVFLATAAATVVACHHGRFEADVCLIMYLVCLIALAVGFISLNYVTLSSADVALHRQAYEIEAHAVSRMGMLAVGCATNLLVAICLKAYLNGKPLLLGARKLEGAMGSQVALVANYAVIICFTTMSLLAYWVQFDSTAMLVAAAPILLLLHNDGVLMVRLTKGPFRYFPPFVAVCATLSWHVQHEARDLYVAGRVRTAVAVLASLLVLVPSHFSIARFLFVTKKRKTTVASVMVLVALNAVVLFATPSQGVRWLAAVGIVALIGRLVIAGHLQSVATFAAL